LGPSKSRVLLEKYKEVTEARKQCDEFKEEEKEEEAELVANTSRTRRRQIDEFGKTVIFVDREPLMFGQVLETLRTGIQSNATHHYNAENSAIFYHELDYYDAHQLPAGDCEDGVLAGNIKSKHDPQQRNNQQSETKRDDNSQQKEPLGEYGHYIPIMGNMVGYCPESDPVYFPDQHVKAQYRGKGKFWNAIIKRKNDDSPATYNIVFPARQKRYWTHLRVLVQRNKAQTNEYTLRVKPMKWGDSHFNVPTMLLDNPHNFIAWAKMRLFLQSLGDESIKYIEVINAGVMALCLGLASCWLIWPFDINALPRAMILASGEIPVLFFSLFILLSTFWMVNKIRQINIILEDHQSMLNQRRLDILHEFASGESTSRSIAYENWGASMELLNDTVKHLRYYDARVKFLSFDLNSALYKVTSLILSVLGAAMSFVFFHRVSNQTVPFL
jgi:hypothetical protein